MPTFDTPKADPMKFEQTGFKTIPTSVKVAYTVFVAVLVPFYLDFHGPANFLWICDIALLVTVLALWLESPFLASMPLVAVFLPSLIWLADFLAKIISGHFLTRWTHYMFRSDIPEIIRAFSLYHAWLPFLLLWIVLRVGYDRKAWLAQTLLTWAVLPICFFLTDPVRAINGVFGASGEKSQTMMAPWLWLMLMMLMYPVCVYLPTHAMLKRFFRDPSSRSGKGEERGRAKLASGDILTTHAPLENRCP